MCLCLMLADVHVQEQMRPGRHAAGELHRGRGAGGPVGLSVCRGQASHTLPPFSHVHMRNQCSYECGHMNTHSYAHMNMRMHMHSLIANFFVFRCQRQDGEERGGGVRGGAAGNGLSDLAGAVCHSPAHRHRAFVSHQLMTAPALAHNCTCFYAYAVVGLE